MAVYEVICLIWPKKLSSAQYLSNMTTAFMKLFAIMITCYGGRWPKYDEDDDFELWHSFALFQAPAAETKVLGKSV